MNLQDIQFNKKEPMYPQLSRYIKKLILADELKHYEELPSRRELALQLSINPNTVQKAYKQLEDEGIIKTISNVKSVVIVNEKILEKLRSEMIEETMKEFVKEGQTSGLDFQQTIVWLTKLWNT